MSIFANKIFFFVKPKKGTGLQGGTHGNAILLSLSEFSWKSQSYLLIIYCVFFFFALGKTSLIRRYTEGKVLISECMYFPCIADHVILG